MSQTLYLHFHFLRLKLKNHCPLSNLISLDMCVYITIWKNFESTNNKLFFLFQTELYQLSNLCKSGKLMTLVKCGFNNLLEFKCETSFRCDFLLTLNRTRKNIVDLYSNFFFDSDTQKTLSCFTLNLKSNGHLEYFIFDQFFIAMKPQLYQNFLGKNKLKLHNLP